MRPALLPSRVTLLWLRIRAISVPRHLLCGASDHGRTCVGSCRSETSAAFATHKGGAGSPDSVDNRALPHSPRNTLMSVRLLMCCCGVLLLASCADRVADVQVPTTHPANPDAPVAPSPAPSTTLDVVALDQLQPVNLATDAAGSEHAHHHHGASAGTVPATAAAPAAAAPTTVPGTPPAVTKDLFWCKHHHEVVQPGPGKCPTCGMKLVPKPADGAAK